jgi:pyruvate formate lyase activating enzyme
MIHDDFMTITSMPPVCIGGITPLTTIDFPGYLSAVFFCQGCAWRCVYCHNPHLQPFDSSRSIYFQEKWEESLEFLRKRRGFLEGVVFSGGEPTFQRDLPAAISEVRTLGLRVGLHTAGPDPHRLALVLPFVDWVGLDIKAPFDSMYDQITRIRDSAASVEESLRLVLKSGVNYQLRTTVYPGLLQEGEIAEIQNQLKKMGAQQSILQPYRPVGCVDRVAQAGVE